MPSRSMMMFLLLFFSITPLIEEIAYLFGIWSKSLFISTYFGIFCNPNTSDIVCDGDRVRIEIIQVLIKDDLRIELASY